jgi:hypothetical protein
MTKTRPLPPVKQAETPVEAETLPGIGPLYTAMTAAAAVSDAPSRAALQRLGAALKAMTDDELFACLESGQPVAPGLEVGDLPESLIRACAAFEARMRQARFFNAEARRSGWWQGVRDGVTWTLAIGLVVAAIVGTYAFL